MPIVIVTDKNQPVKNVCVEAVPVSGFPKNHQIAHTDADGRAVLPNTPGRFHIKVASRRYDTVDFPRDTVRIALWEIMASQ